MDKEEIDMKKTTIILFILFSFGFFLGAGTASAATTGTLPGPEIPLVGSGGILDQIYGWSNLSRIDDDLDQIWFPADGTATVQAKFAAYTQNFGYIPDLNGDNNFDESFVSLFIFTGNGLNLAGPTANLSSGNFNFLWALDPSGAPLWTSLPSQNSDKLDHMVTWLITGGSGNTAGNFVIAWEDLWGGGDRDFNDLVVEVNVAPVPIPGTILLLSSGLVGLVALRRRKK